MVGSKYQFLIEEYKILKDLFIDAEKIIQTSFRYYITILTATSGGLIALVTRDDIDKSLSKINLNLDVVIQLFLLFIFFLGSVYISIICWRYGNLARFGKAMDEIRFALINDIGVYYLPGSYKSFKTKSLNYRSPKTPKINIWGIIKIPSFQIPQLIINFLFMGAYQTFIACISSISLTVFLSIFLNKQISYISNLFRTYSIVISTLILVLIWGAFNFFSHRIGDRLLEEEQIAFDVHR